MHDPLEVQAVERSNYPAAHQEKVRGRLRRRLGEALGLSNFGVNLVTLRPGAQSALRHWHTRQDEFVYVLAGTVILLTDAGETQLRQGQMAGFPKGRPNGHCLVNRSAADATYLEVGDRTPGDGATYPDDDLVAVATPAGWVFTHKDGTPY
jgi:uncharacterized cupin superfamily protein